MKRTGKGLIRAAVCIAAAAAVCAAMTGCGGSRNASNVVEDIVTAVISDPAKVALVKEGTFEAYPDQKIGKAFDGFFGSPLWSEFESTDGQQVVEFNGTFMYMEKETNATIQFIVDEDAGTFELYTIEFNDVPQNKLMQLSMIAKIFEGE